MYIWFQLQFYLLIKGKGGTANGIIKSTTSCIKKYNNHEENETDEYNTCNEHCPQHSDKKKLRRKENDVKDTHLEALRASIKVSKSKR